jgi:hypothetical protein
MKVTRLYGSCKRAVFHLHDAAGAPGERLAAATANHKLRGAWAGPPPQVLSEYHPNALAAVFATKAARVTAALVLRDDFVALTVVYFAATTQAGLRELVRVARDKARALGHCYVGVQRTPAFHWLSREGFDVRMPPGLMCKRVEAFPRVLTEQLRAIMATSRMKLVPGVTDGRWWATLRADGDRIARHHQSDVFGHDCA